MKNKNIGEYHNVDDLMLIEDERGREETDGKEKLNERRVMDRVSIKNKPLMDCTNSMKLKIEQDERRSKLRTSLLRQDTKLEQRRRKARFYFNKKWITKPGIEEVIKRAWESECEGFLMFQVAAKITLCRLEILKWNRLQSGNAARMIQEIKDKMESLRE